MYYKRLVDFIRLFGQSTSLLEGTQASILDLEP